MILQTKSLFLSAGHSDSDPGAAGNGHTEADIVLEFRDLVAECLRDKLSFNTDGGPGVNLPLRGAVKLAAAHDVAVEFHCNAFHKPSATGVETLSSDANKPLGRALCQAISDTLGITNRGAKGEASGQHSRLAFISQGGGIIIELFFITNRSDLDAYLGRKHETAKAVADTIVNYVTTEYS